MKKIILTVLLLLPSVTYANPFGVGVAYATKPYASVQLRNAERSLQLNLALNLVGVGGYVRIWCFLGQIWSAPQGNGPAECAAAVNEAYQLGMIPSVVFQESPWADDQATSNPAVGNLNYTSYANQVASLVQALTIPANKHIWIELANEPNWTDWWPSGTCSATIRARETARASLKTAQAIRALNRPQVKIAFASLAAFGDYDAVPNADGKCTGKRGAYGLPSSDFVSEMKQTTPELFSRTYLDGWNSHAYPLKDYFLCQTGNCPQTAQDPALVAYRQEMIVAGMPADFPILITEAGHGETRDHGTLVADFFAKKNADGSWVGAFPQLWRTKTDYNNVIAVMGFVLADTPSSGNLFAWATIANSSTVVLGDVFHRMLAYRLDTIDLNRSVFDPQWYLAHHTDLQNIYGSDLAAATNHWNLYGKFEGRWGTDSFRANEYLMMNQDIRNYYNNKPEGASYHFSRYGSHEGRAGRYALRSEIFDVSWYISHHADLAYLANDHEGARRHWLAHGIYEGRRGSAGFSVKAYLQRYADLSGALGSTNYERAIEHYILNGMAEGRYGGE